MHTRLGVHMAMQQQGRIQLCNERVEYRETLVRRVRFVPYAARWSMSEQDVHPAPGPRRA